MKKWLKTISLLVVILISSGIFLGGCGTGSQAPENQSSQVQTSQTPASQPQTPETTQATESETKQPLTKIRIGVMTDTLAEYLPVIGKDQKIFEKYGLEVESVSFATGIDTVNAVTLDQLDIGGAADFAILNRFGSTEKSELRIFARTGVSVSSRWSLFVKGDDIQSPKDLAGKSIVTQKGTVVEYWIGKILSQYDVDPASVTQLPVSSAQEGVALIKTGQASAVWASGKAVELLKEIPGVRAIADLGTINAPTTNVAVAKESYLKANQTAVENYLKANDEIYDFIAKNPDQAADIVIKSINTPKEQVLLNFQSSNNVIDFTQETLDTLNDIYDWANGAGFIKTPFKVIDFINTDALKAAFPDRASYK